MKRSTVRASLAGACIVPLCLFAACGGDDEVAGPTRHGSTAEAGSATEGGPSPTTNDATLDTTLDTTVTDAPGADTSTRPPRDGGFDRDAQRNEWALNAYCDPDAGCGFPQCIVLGDGGVAGRECLVPFGRCSVAGDPDAGIAPRAYACIPRGAPVWDFDGLCDQFTSVACAAVEAGACPPIGDSGIAGQPCTPTREPCIDLAAEKLFVCQPGGGLAWMFDGYCDAGPTAACTAGIAPCVDVDGGIAASACATVNTRCLATDKVYLCARR